MVQLCLYRIFQEALRNLEKHARAEQVELALHLGLKEVRLAVRDDGRGFHLPPRLGLLVDEGHFGIFSISWGKGRSCACPNGQPQGFAPTF